MIPEPEELRELDALLAEKVFGWRWVQDYGGGKMFGWRWVQDYGGGKESRLVSPERAAGYLPEYIRQRPAEEHLRKYQMAMPRFSFDPSAMLSLLDKLRESGWRVKISLGPDAPLDDWWATLDRFDEEAPPYEVEKKGIAHATTLPLAVAMAAKKTVEN